MEEILQFLRENSPFYFTSVDGDKPRVRPLGFFMEYNGKLYFGIGKEKASYKQLIANPNVEVCTCNNQRQWIRIRGTAVFDDSAETLAKAYETKPNLKNTYNEKSGLIFGIFYLKDGEAEIADMRGHFKKISF